MILSGYNIVVASAHPRMTLSEKVPVTPEFRAEMDSWLLQFFGTHCPVKRGEVFVLEAERSMVVHPADYAELCRSAKTGEAG